MGEFHGSPGEGIVECNLSYRLAGLLLWLRAHHSPLQLSTDTAEPSRMTTDTVKDILAIGSEAPATVSDGGSGNADTPLSALLVPLFQRTTTGPLPISYDARMSVPSGSGTELYTKAV